MLRLLHHLRAVRRTGYRRRGALTLALVAVGCGPFADGGRSRPRLQHRWIADEPAGPGSAIRIARESREFVWKLETAEDLAAWEQVNVDLESRLTGKGLRIRSSHHDPILRRNVRLDASRVHAIRVLQSGPGPRDAAFLELFWAGPGESFHPDRSLRLHRADASGGGSRSSYTFRVGDHPGWQGEIRRLRLDPTSVPDQPVEVHSLTGLRKVVDKALLEKALARPWRVDLGTDARPALLAPPGFPIERELEVVAGSELRLAFGLQQQRGPAIDFRVVARAAGEAPRVLLERRLDPRDQTQRRRWFDARVDLADLARRRVRICLETSAAETVDLVWGFPVWGNPEIVVTQQRPSRPNVVLIVIDTLRADHLSLYGYQRRTSPQIDSWAARRGVVFRHAVAPAPWTLPSHVSLFTGRNAMAHGVNFSRAAPPSFELLAERLRAQGYATAAFTGGAFLSPDYGLAQGFDRFDYWRHPQRIHRIGKDLEQRVGNAIAWLESAPSKPFLLFLHTYEVHAPYMAREPYYSRFAGSSMDAPLPKMVPRSDAPSPETGWRHRAYFTERFPEPASQWRPIAPERLATLQDLYDSGISFTDEQIGRLLRRLAALGLEEETLVVLTSDHGEGLGEKGTAGHYNLYDFTLLIPLVISFPDGRAAGTTIPRQVRLIDVAPTICEVLGIPAGGEVDGSSLMPLIADPQARFPAVAESYAGSKNYGVSLRLDDRLKFIYQHSAWPFDVRRELFDLVEDPSESVNLAASDPGTRELQERVRSRYLQTSTHLAVRLTNGGPSPLVVELRGPLAGIFNVKGFELPCPCVEWTENRTRARVPPGVSYSLYLEGRSVKELTVTAQSGPEGSARLEQQVRVGELAAPRRWILDGTGWQEAAAPPAVSEIGVELEWVGARDRQAPVELDRELAEQLRELGYIQ